MGEIDVETSLFDSLGNLLLQRCTGSLVMVGDAEVVLNELSPEKGLSSVLWLWNPSFHWNLTYITSISN